MTSVATEKGISMSEYRLFKVIRTDGQKYFDIEYVRDVVMCGECTKRKKNGFCLEYMRYEKDDEGFCSYGEREGE